MPVIAKRLSPIDPEDSTRLEDSIGLCLSGGGYRAMLFHAGVLFRMNELGLLRKLARISSVSGGSMAAGALAACWRGLTWDGKGKATNLRQAFLLPVLAQADDTIDVSSALAKFNPFDSPAAAAARSYDRNFAHGMALSALPDKDAPLFVFNATSLMTGKTMRMRRDLVADYEVGVIEGVPVTLSAAVAASAAFPPVLSPAVLSLTGGKMRDKTAGRLASGEFLKTAWLTDGGVYDNLGTETVWKRCRTVFVSNAGKPFGGDAEPSTDFVQQMLRVLDIVMNQSEDLRERILAHAYEVGARTGAMWSLTTGSEDHQQRPTQLTEAEFTRVQAIPTRLSRFGKVDQALLLKAGYAHAASRIRAKYKGVPDVPDGQWPAP
jgi:NTE family protein